MTHAATPPTGGNGRAVRRLLLFVARGEPNSAIAQENLRRICDGQTHVDCRIQVVDVLTDYGAALEHRVLVTPCLLMTDPGPRVMIVGTLTDEARVIAALRIGAG